MLVNQKKYVVSKNKLRNTTRRKSRNYLTNISYNGIKEEDLFDRSFVFDVYLLTTKSINPFLFKQKIFDAKNREMISIVLEECNKRPFYKHICKRNNFMYLNSKNVIYPHVANFVWKYLEEDEENFDKIKNKLIENKKIFQFVYSSTYPEFTAPLKNEA